MWRVLALALVVCPLAPSAAGAQGAPLRYSCEGQRCVVSNATPARFALLLVERLPDGSAKTEALIVQPNQTLAPRIVSGAQVSIADAHLLEAGFTVEPGKTCGTTRIGVPLTKAAEQSEIAGVAARTAQSIDVLSDPVATQAREAVKEVAMLELDNRLDALRAERWDRFLSSLQQDLYSDGASRYASQFQIAQDRVETFQQDLNDHFKELTAMAEAYMRISDAYLGQLENQADRLEPHARNAEQKRASLQQALTDADRRTDAGRIFAADVSQEFKKRALTPASVRVVSGLSRACGEPTLAEVVELAVEAPQDVNVLGGTLKFDRGGSTSVAFRRMGRSDKWRTTVYWPVEATRVNAQVWTYGGGRAAQVPGDLRLGTLSYKGAVDTTIKQLKEIEKAYKKAKFRSEGGDATKTIRIF